jgi:phage shock protein A
VIAVGDLTEILVRVRRGIVDCEASRERVRTQITALEVQKVKLRTQQAKAAEMGRPDLAGEARQRVQLVDAQIADLTGMAEKLDREIVKLAEAAGRLQSKIDGPRPTTKPAKSASYAMVKAAVPSSMTFRGIMTGAESSAMHLVS